MSKDNADELSYYESRLQEIQVELDKLDLDWLVKKELKRALDHEMDNIITEKTKLVRAQSEITAIIQEIKGES